MKGNKKFRTKESKSMHDKASVFSLVALSAQFHFIIQFCSNIIVVQVSFNRMLIDKSERSEIKGLQLRRILLPQTKYFQTALIYPSALLNYLRSKYP